jgi:hypothetical protein
MMSLLLKAVVDERHQAMLAEAAHARLVGDALRHRDRIRVPRRRNRRTGVGAAVAAASTGRT